MSLAVVPYRGIHAWSGSTWAVGLASILYILTTAACEIRVPPHKWSLDDVWHARRTRFKVPILSIELGTTTEPPSIRIDTLNVLLPPANTDGSDLRIHLSRRVVVIHAAFDPSESPVAPCAVDRVIVPRDAYDLHLQLTSGLADAFFGRVIDIRCLSGISTLPRRFEIGPLIGRSDLRRVSIIAGAGLRLPSRERGDLVIFSELRLPSIDPGVLARHEPLLRGIFDRIDALDGSRHISR
jgi:hypothetical protein